MSSTTPATTSKKAAKGLTDTAVRKAKAGEKPYKMTDTQGLYLMVAVSGGKLWRYNYRHGGKRLTLALGAYPDVGLADARERHQEARRLLAQGIDPGAYRKLATATAKAATANTFGAVALEWFAKQAPTWVPRHAERVKSRLDRDILPYLGARPIADLTPPEILETLRRIEERGAAATAHRARQGIGAVCRFAVCTGRLTSDPTRDLHGALAPLQEEHFPAITEPKEVGDLLRVLDGYHGTPIVRAALHLAPLVFVRPGELRTAKWEDIDLDAAEWRFEASKTGQAHIVPLARQAVAILRDLHPLTGSGPYVFPSARTTTRPMSDNAVLAALRRMGIPKERMTGHGFRAMAKTNLEEAKSLKYGPHLTEHQLGHEVKDVHGRAYNRTTHLLEREEMMQRWADYLDELKAGGKVLDFKAA